MQRLISLEAKKKRQEAILHVLKFREEGKELKFVLSIKYEDNGVEDPVQIPDAKKLLPDIRMGPGRRIYCIIEEINNSLKINTPQTFIHNPLIKKHKQTKLLSTPHSIEL